MYSEIIIGKYERWEDLPFIIPVNLKNIRIMQIVIWHIHIQLHDHTKYFTGNKLIHRLFWWNKFTRKCRKDTLKALLYICILTATCLYMPTHEHAHTTTHQCIYTYKQAQNKIQILSCIIMNCYNSLFKIFEEWSIKIHIQFDYFFSSSWENKFWPGRGGTHL